MLFLFAGNLMIVRAPRIPKAKQRLLFKYFVGDVNAKQAAEFTKVSRACANDWYRHWREKIYESLRRAPRFSGEVEVDIGFFAGRSSKKTSAYVRRLAGLPTAEIIAKRPQISKAEKKKIMVLGILQRGGDVYLHPIKRKDRVSLESVIRLVVEPGSTIYSDMEAGLSKLKLDGYRHERVNHSLEYARKGGIHLNGIESFWSRARGRMGRNFKGVPRSTLPLHIKECEFRENHRHDFEKSVKKIL